MAIKMRTGREADLNISKAIPGEWLVSTDTRYIRMCFAPGIVLRMATYESFENDMEQIEQILEECRTIQEAVVRINEEVSNNADAVVEYTNQAKQYRDEAEQFRNEAREISGGNFLTSESAIDFLEASTRENIQSSDSVKTIFGKIKKWFTDLKPHAFSNPINNLLATDAGTSLDAVQGKVLNDMYTGISQKLFVSTNILGDRAIKTDMLDVDFANYTSEKNMVHRIGTGDASTLTNSPIKSGQFYGKWECIPYALSGTSSNSRLMVKITEFYPVQGRVWFNHYNWNAWVGWFSEYDRLTGHLNDISRSKVAFGEMGAYENLEVRGSVYCQFNVYNKCDIHISCMIMKNNIDNTTSFAFLSGDKIRKLLGINSFSNNAFYSRVVIQNFSGTNLANLAGYGGFMAYTGVISGDIQVGRIYTTDGQIGPWGMNRNLFEAGTIFEIDLFNCSYT